MLKMNIGFRLDSSLKIGTGHLTRALSLANYLKDLGHQCHFFCRPLEGNLNHLILPPFIVHTLAPPNGEFDPNGPPHAAWLDHDPNLDALEIKALIEKKQIHVMLLDHYALDAHWEKIIFEKVKRLIVIDDLLDREHCCHMLVNLNLGAEAFPPSRINPDAKWLLGTKYLLIRPEFLHYQKQRIRSELKRIILFFGGVDKEGYAEKFMQLKLIGHFSGIQFDLITRKAEYKRWEKTYSNLHVHINPSNISEIMYHADLYIGSGGTITTERIYMGLPGLINCVARNQELSNQAVFSLGIGRKINFIDDSAAVFQILNELTLNPSWLTETSKACYDVYHENNVDDFIHPLLSGL